MIVPRVMSVQAAGSAKAELRRMSEEEFEAFYRRNGRPLMAYLTRLAGDAHLAEDLFQKAFYLFLRTPLPAGDDDAMRPYLYRIATNVMHDEWRRRKRAGEQPLDGVDVADARRDSAAVELRHDFARTFDKLTPNERALLWFAHVEGLAHDEVAQHVGVKANSVRVLLHRARRKLSSLLQQRGGEEQETGS